MTSLPPDALLRKRARAYVLDSLHTRDAAALSHLRGRWSLPELRRVRLFVDDLRAALDAPLDGLRQVLDDDAAVRERVAALVGARLDEAPDELATRVEVRVGAMFDEAVLDVLVQHRAELARASLHGPPQPLGLQWLAVAAALVTQCTEPSTPERYAGLMQAITLGLGPRGVAA